MNNLRQEADNIFYKISAIGVLFFAVFIFLAFLLQKNLRFLLGTWSSNLVEAFNCAGYLSFSDKPAVFISLFLSSLLLIAFFLFSLIKYLSLKLRTKRYVDNNLKYRRKYLSSKTKRVASELGLENRVVEIDSHHFSIFCYGFFRPKICLSKSLLSKLSNPELKAIFLHEKHHIVSLDTFKLFVVKFISSSLFFLPQLKFLATKYYSLAELAADNFATEKAQSKSYLASAMYKFLKLNEAHLENKDLALASFNLLISERINKLKDSSYEINIVPKNNKTIFNTLALIIFSLLFVFSIKTTATAVSHETSACMARAEGIYTRCQAGDLMVSCPGPLNEELDAKACIHHLEQSSAH